jgi:DNA-binding NtrC family response regulator
VSAPAVLLVDDEPGVLYTLREVLIERGHRVLTAPSGATALPQLDDASVVVTDLQMPGMSGLELIAAITARDPSLPVILLTAHGSEKVAVAAVKAGAYDYLTKPFDIDEVAVVIERALEARALRVANKTLAAERALGQADRRRLAADAAAARRHRAGGQPRRDGAGARRDRHRQGVRRAAAARAVGRGPAGRWCASTARRSRPTSPRPSCSATSRARSPARSGTRRGFFAEADGGTLVLDEVGELPLAVQAKLLRALQEGEIQPVGSGRVERVDVRVVASTNRDLVAEAKAGHFREDLYYRLAVVELVVPPLRDRTDDIPALAAEFARRYGEKFGLGPLTLEPALVSALTAAPWPGNVRQLENTIARMAALAHGRTLTFADFVPDAGIAPRPPSVAAPVVADEAATPTTTACRCASRSRRSSAA